MSVDEDCSDSNGVAAAIPTITPSTVLAYDTRDIMTTPPSPPSSPNPHSITQSWALGTNLITEPSMEMNTNDFDPSASSDVTFSQSQRIEGDQGTDSDSDSNLTPWNHNVTTESLSLLPLTHSSWPDIMLDIETAVDNNTRQLEEEEEALLPMGYSNKESPQRLATSSDTLNDRLTFYKQPCMADDESDTSSMTELVSLDEQALEDERMHLVCENNTNDNNMEVEEIQDKYQFLEDLHPEHVLEEDDEDPRETPQNSTEYSSTLLLDSQTENGTAPLQLILEKDDSQQQSISWNPVGKKSHYTQTKAIPLIQPPSEEKLRKWLMSKPSITMGQSETSSFTVSIPIQDDSSSNTNTPDFFDMEIDRQSPSLVHHDSSIASNNNPTTESFSYNNSSWADFPMASTAVGLDMPLQVNSSSSHTSISHSLQPHALPRYHITPVHNPSPFELATLNLPSIITMSLNFLGDPAAVCRMKMVNRFCYKAITENEHLLMKDAVRLGGLKTTLRPAFWMWITLEKCQGKIIQAHDDEEEGYTPSLLDISEYENFANRGKDGKWHERIDSDVSQVVYFLTENECEVSLQQSHRWISYRSTMDFQTLSKIGEDGKWQSVIERDVRRAFGNMPPHKTGAKFKADSIVKALVTWGRNRLIKRGVKGGGETSPLRCIGILRKPSGFVPETSPPWENSEHDSDSVVSESPTDTVSDWGGITQISPIGSRLDDLLGESSEAKDVPSHGNHSNADTAGEYCELALSGNGLTSEKKSELQDRLRFILYALSSAHEEVGYCQGIDYVVAHLLRVLQDTIEWKALLGKSFPPVISKIEKSFEQAKDRAILVEEVVFRVMDTLLTTYGLRHFYWPELRCLKTACRVFEWLVHQKLPVLSDHFQHHELNVGIFALGWFQTLFLYIPAMPSTTINHMWDIWLVERSMKIFFRVATAILFLSQPILLNHDQEGMMIYLNTFPDATLLKHDILIPCALQIKVTNQMLIDIETRVSKDNDIAHGFLVDDNRSEAVDQQQKQLCAPCSNTFDCNNIIHAFE